MADLCELADVREWLGSTTTAADALLSRLITAASEFVERHTGRSFSGIQNYTEIYDGTGRDRMQLRQWPVVSVSSIKIAPSIEITEAATEFPPASGTFTLESPPLSGGIQTLIVHGHCFPRGRGAMQVTYTAGFADVPADVRQAVVELVGERYKHRDRIGLNSKSIGNGESISFLQRDMSENVRSILQRYKSVVPL